MNSSANMTSARSIEFYRPGFQFEWQGDNYSKSVGSCGSPVRRAAVQSSAVGSRKGGRRSQGFASASVALHESVMSAPQAPVSAKVR